MFEVAYGQMGSEVESIIGMTMQTVRGPLTLKVYESRDINREAKVTLFEEVVNPMLMYGPWVGKYRLQATEMRVWRKIASDTRMNNVWNE